MPGIIGRYTSHLRQLWRLPYRIDQMGASLSERLIEAHATATQALAEQLSRERQAWRQHLDITVAHALQRVADALRNGSDAARQTIAQQGDRIIAALGGEQRQPDAAAGTTIARLQEDTAHLRQDVRHLHDLQTTTDHAALGIQRARLRDRHGALDIETDHPVAYESPDHLVPWGTAQDNSRSQLFNARLINLIPPERLSLLDLGCAGGGAVRSMIEQGFLAAGVEGSDYSQRRMRAEWVTIPDFLFTADITKPFRIVSGLAAEGMRFGVVTLWEVIEHIAEPDLPALFANIDAHLAPNGLVIMSVSPNPDIVDGRELHQIVQQRPWWHDTLRSLGWTDHPEIIAWLGDDLVRWEVNAPNSFHFALSRSAETPALTRRARHLLAGVGRAVPHAPAT